MSELLDIIKQRRSIRKYKKRPVPIDIIKQILETANYAPSAHNAQPWRFILLTEDTPKRLLIKAMMNSWLQDLNLDGKPEETQNTLTKTYAERFLAAPILIIACLTMENMRRYQDAKRQQSERDLSMQSLSSSIENLLLATHAKGLGACWYAAPAFCKDAVRQALKIPANVEPQALITMGYPDEAPTAPRRKPIGDFSFSGVWNKKLQSD